MVNLLVPPAGSVPGVERLCHPLTRSGDDRLAGELG
jgi:hypothetical protein